MKKSECQAWVDAAKRAETMVESLLADREALRQVVSDRDELLRVATRELERVTLQKGSSDEQASETYAHLQQVMELARERGKVISILVQKIDALEAA